MGEQSGLVIAAVVCCFVAFVVNVVAMGTPYWIEGYVGNETSSWNLTSNESVVAGLWEICADGDCRSTLSYSRPAWFISCQALHPLAVTSSLLALLAFGAFCALATDAQMTTRLNFGVLFFSILTVLLLVASMTLLGTYGETEMFGVAEPRRLGWSFYVAVVGVVFSLLTTLMSAREAYLLSRAETPYSDL